MAVALQTYGPAALQAIALLLLLAGAMAFAFLAKGALVLRDMARDNPRDESLALLKSRLTPAVTVILAPRTFGPAARTLTRRLLGLHFGNLEVVIALNGPPETDLAAWREEFRLTPSKRPLGDAPAGVQINGVFESRDPVRLVVLNLAATLPAQALHMAVHAAQSSVIGLFSDDCDFAPEVLLRLIQPMLEDPRRTIAVCGVDPGKPGVGPIREFAALEHLRAWLSRSAAFSGWNLLTPTGGAAMLISREALLSSLNAKAGGFRDGPLDLFLQLHAVYRASGEPYRIAFMPGAGCSPQAAQSKAEIYRALAELQRQALRCATAGGAFPVWLRAALIVVYVLWPLLETAAYLLTLAGLLAGWVDWQLALLMFLTTVALGMLLSMSAVSLRELAAFDGADPARLTRLFQAAFVDNLGFRQARNIRLLWQR
jgi:hypothetical protein